jgi:hypothetical protein
VTCGTQPLGAVRRGKNRDAPVAEEPKVTTAQSARSTDTSHPFVAGIAARDPDAVAETLASDVVLYTTAARTPLVGRDVVAELYVSVLESFDELRIVDEFQSGDTHAFFWEGQIQGRFVAGADRFRLDAEGKVRENTVVGRPLSGLSTFLTGIGFRFASRRRGPLVGWLLRLTALPLGPLFSLLDPVTQWVARGRSGGRR